MEMQTIVTILVIIGLIIGVLFMAYFYFRDRSLQKIRKDVYELFLRAEHKYLNTGEGKQKMEYVIQRARSLLPPLAQFFITEDLLRKVVQSWFDAVKDLLDDGKYNQSTKKSAE